LGESDTAAGVSGTGSPGVAGFGASGDADGVRGFGSGTFSGVAGFGDPKSTCTGVLGQGGGAKSQGVRGIGGGGPNISPPDPAGVFGQGGAGDANGVEGRGSGQFAGVAGFGDDTNDPNNGIGVFAVGGAPAPNSSTHGGPGLYAIGNGGPAFGPATKVTQPVGVFAVGGGDHAPGIWGVGAGGPAFSAVNPITAAPGVLGVGGIQDDGPGVMGQGGGALGDGVQGFSKSGNGVLGDSANGVGVRAVSTSSTALVAIGSTGLIATSTVHTNLAGEFNGNVLVNGNFTVQGGHKSAAVAFPDGSHRLLYCTESPESWFEDFGFRSFSRGEVHVALDPDFNAIVNNAAYHVFITEYDGNNALYVTQRTSFGFVVKAKDPSASGTFSYRVVAKRGDIPTARFEKIDLPGGPSYLPAHPDDGSCVQSAAA